MNWKEFLFPKKKAGGKNDLSQAQALSGDEMKSLRERVRELEVKVDLLLRAELVEFEEARHSCAEPRFSAREVDQILADVAKELAREGLIKECEAFILRESESWWRRRKSVIVKDMSIDDLVFNVSVVNGLIMEMIEEYRRQGWLSEDFESWEPETANQLLDRLSRLSQVFNFDEFDEFKPA